MASPLGEDSSPPLFVSPLVPGRLALSLDGPITQQSNDSRTPHFQLRSSPNCIRKNCINSSQMQRKLLINSIPDVIPVDQKESEDQKIVCEESDRDDEKSKKSRGPQRPAERFSCRL